MRTYQQILFTAAVLGAFAVAIGAFGAHGLKGLVSPEHLVSYDTAVKYQFYHVFALLFTGIFYSVHPIKNLIYAAWSFLIGILFFSGSIYFLSTREIHGVFIPGLGLITPIGGLLFILGWLLLAFAVLKKA